MVRKSNFNYSKLRGRIMEVCRTEKTFAAAVGLSPRTVSAKLNNNRWWKQTEMSRACEVLKFSELEIPNYFFVETEEDV